MDLESGADDYLAKPFNDREVIASIQAILRHSYRTEQQQTNETSTSALEVDYPYLNPGQQKIILDETLLELTGTEFTLLYLLAQYLDQVV